MTIVDLKVRVFRYTSTQVRDSDGHTHPGDPHEARQALLTVIADDGSEGHCLGPVEVIRPYLVNGFLRCVLIGQRPFDRERIWQDLRTGSAAAPVSLPTARWQSSRWRCGTSPAAGSACRCTS